MKQRKPYDYLKNDDDTDLYLDTKEQDELVKQLSTDAERQAKFIRTSFICLYLIVTCAITYCTIYTLFYPSLPKLLHQEIFQPGIEQSFFIIYYVSVIIILIIDMLIISNHTSQLSRPKRRVLYAISWSLSIASSVIWIAIFVWYEISILPLFWLPILPIAGM